MSLLGKSRFYEKQKESEKKKKDLSITENVFHIFPRKQCGKFHAKTLFLKLCYLCNVIWATSIERGPSNMRNMRKFGSSCPCGKLSPVPWLSFSYVLSSCAFHTFCHPVILLADTDLGLFCLYMLEDTFSHGAVQLMLIYLQKITFMKK